MAFKRKIRPYNPFCDFCATQDLYRNLMDDRLENYHKRAHVKHARTQYGVMAHVFIIDNHARVVERTTKTFVKYRYCPMCGYDYRKGLFLVDGVYRKEPPTFD